MVQVPDQLVWECTRKTSCFLRKKNGQTKRSGKICMSLEPCNIKSMHLLQYSSIANSKVFDVVCTPDNKAQLITKTASKSSTNPKGTFVTTNVHQNFTRAAKIVLGQTSDVYYRRDLKAAALAKYTKCYQANRRAKGITKPVPTKKGRGTIKN